MGGPPVYPSPALPPARELPKPTGSALHVPGAAVEDMPLADAMAPLTPPTPDKLPRAVMGDAPPMPPLPPPMAMGADSMGAPRETEKLLVGDSSGASVPPAAVGPPVPDMRATDRADMSAR